ncbi:MAG TPA: nucleotidyltransferase domain-containing protein [Phycisphaerae bacterium]|nr:nucleotidyltransferase domain-containing protein [Phycisphaerae bacterium]HNU46436.1 nucleotidyltransferase domain-containing protein [Phycisphaerae bacterium]
MVRTDILAEIKDRLRRRHGARLRGVVLYGSEARGEAGPDSDIDILVMLAEPIDYGRDLEANLDALYPLALQIGRRISPKPVGVTHYQTHDCPLYRAARSEGIPL